MDEHEQYNIVKKLLTHQIMDAYRMTGGGVNFLDKLKNIINKKNIQEKKDIIKKIFFDVFKISSSESKLSNSIGFHETVYNYNDNDNITCSAFILDLDYKNLIILIKKLILVKLKETYCTSTFDECISKKTQCTTIPNKNCDNIYKCVEQAHCMADQRIDYRNIITKFAKQTAKSYAFDDDSIKVEIYDNTDKYKFNKSIVTDLAIYYDNSYKIAIYHTGSSEKHIDFADICVVSDDILKKISYQKAQEQQEQQIRADQLRKFFHK